MKICCVWEYFGNLQVVFKSVLRYELKHGEYFENFYTVYKCLILS